MSAIDIEPLLLPISESEPSGVWLKHEPVYDQIKEARREDEITGDKGVWESKQKKADWPTSRRLCFDALKKQTKDLWIAAWLLEAWTAMESYDGLKAGLDLMTRLCAEFWDTMYPEIEDGDVEYRVSPVSWLGEKYIVKVKSLPITAPRGASALTILDRENAVFFDSNARKNPSLLEETDMTTQMTLEKFNQSERDTPDEYYFDLKDKIEGIINSIAALEKEMDARCGRDAPSLRAFKNLFADVQLFAESTLRRRGHLDGGDIIIVGDPLSEPPKKREDTNGGGKSGESIIQSRDAAYAQIREAAEYLKKIEPHSPAPYLIERALNWGKMTLPELLAELVADESNRGAIFGLLGIASKHDSGDGSY